MNMGVGMMMRIYTSFNYQTDEIVGGFKLKLLYEL